MKRVEIHKIEAKKGEQKETNVQLARQKENMKRKKKTAHDSKIFNSVRLSPRE